MQPVATAIAGCIHLLLQLLVTAAIHCCSYPLLQLSIAAAIGCCSYWSLQLGHCSIHHCSFWLLQLPISHCSGWLLLQLLLLWLVLLQHYFLDQCVFLFHLIHRFFYMRKYKWDFSTSIKLIDELKREHKLPVSFCTKGLCVGQTILQIPWWYAIHF